MNETTRHRGYWPSGWPVGGAESQASATLSGPGLSLQPTDHLTRTTRSLRGVVAGLVRRDQGELYLYRRTVDGGGALTGWVERLDSNSLEPQAASGPLASGSLPTSAGEMVNGRVAPPVAGSIAVHANGHLYTADGACLHRLDPGCSVVSRVALESDRLHLGPVILPDGMLLVVDLPVESGGGPLSSPRPSTVTVLDQDLNVQEVVTLPEAVTGRPVLGPSGFASLSGATGGPGRWSLVVPGFSGLHRLWWDGSTLTFDPMWRVELPTLEGGPLGNLTVAGGRIWGVTNTVDHHGLDRHRRWTDPVQLLAVDEGRPDHPDLVPVTELASGYSQCGPVVMPGIAVAADAGNAGLVAFDVSPGAFGEMLWYQPFRVTAPPLVFADTGELVVNDERALEDRTSDDLVVLDVATGRLKARVESGANHSAGGWVCPGWERDLYYGGNGVVSRFQVRGLETGLSR